MRRTQRGALELLALLALLAPLVGCDDGTTLDVDSDGDGVADPEDDDDDDDGIPDDEDDDDDGDGIPDDEEDDGGDGDGDGDSGDGDSGDGDSGDGDSGDGDSGDGDSGDGDSGDGDTGDGDTGDGDTGDGDTGDGDTGDGDTGDGDTGDGDFDGPVKPGDSSPEIEIGANNLFPSPYPPGGLTPENAPQIIVFGWDDMGMTGDFGTDTSQPDNGQNFIEKTFGDIKNPNGKDGHVAFYQNGCYLPNSEGQWGNETMVTLKAGEDLRDQGFEVGNHSFDHLETNSVWTKIPAAGKGAGGWKEGVGRLLDQANWKEYIIGFNDNLLRTSYKLDKLYGFRAPRLEINAAGLLALEESGYLYDTNMEEGVDWEHVAVATAKGAEERGFKWVVWPYSLDNGSPGVWQSQDFGEKAYLDTFPRGVWEVPVYMVYIPDNGLQQTLAARMKKEITMEDTSWIGDRVREITAFDFNTFLYARMKKSEFVEVMKYNFLLRYNGNRAPMTFGAHPEEFSSRYDQLVLSQPNNADFLDVLSYNTYQDRKDAVKEFVEWVQDNYADDAYFMSGRELVEFMKKPFDKSGNTVAADAPAGPASDNLFQLASAWQINKDELGSSGSVTVDDGNTMSVEFKVAENNDAAMEYAYIDASSHFEKGALAGVTHIDILYESDSPFRLRLLPDSADDVSMQVLLAGTGGERTARIRIQDFRPDNYTAPDKIAAADFVDDGYLAGVSGISVEAAPATGKRDYTVQIKRIVVHGLKETANGTTQKALKPAVARPRQAGVRGAAQHGRGSAVHWPAHRESHAH